MWPYAKNIIQLIISPDHGWEDVAETSSPRRAFKLMTILLIIAALSPLCSLIYLEHPETLVIWQSTIIVFAAFWATFFVGEFVLGMFLHTLSEDEELNDSIRSFCAYVTGLLSLQVIIDSMLPIPVAILQLWPIYVVIIIWRGMRFFDIPEKHTGKFLLLTVPSLILPSQIIIRLFYSNFAQRNSKKSI